MRENTRLYIFLSRPTFPFPFLSQLTIHPSDIRPQSTYSESHTDKKHRTANTVIDVAESEYRSRVQPNYRNEFSVVGTTVDAPSHRSSFKASSHVDKYTVDSATPRPVYHESTHVTGTTVDTPAPRSSFHQKVDIVEETVDSSRYAPQPKQSKMGYYDEDGKHLPLSHLIPPPLPQSQHTPGVLTPTPGHYHSFRAGLHKMADRIAHPEGHDRVEVSEARETRRPRASSAEGSPAPNTVTIPCHHIRLGDILILQGRPCQVIRISTSAATGQHRYLGVDLFTKQLHEESSFVSNPAPSVVVQTMLGPVFKQYRVLDMQEGAIVAMTETGDVKQNLPVIDQSSLWTRLQKAFESGRGSVRVLVVTDHGREMAVDMKVVHGSRL